MSVSVVQIRKSFEGFLLAFEDSFPSLKQCCFSYFQMLFQTMAVNNDIQ